MLLVFWLLASSGATTVSSHTGTGSLCIFVNLFLLLFDLEIAVLDFSKRGGKLISAVLDNHIKSSLKRSQARVEQEKNFFLIVGFPWRASILVKRVSLKTK